MWVSKKLKTDLIEGNRDKGLKIIKKSTLMFMNRDFVISMHFLHCLIPHVIFIYTKNIYYLYNLRIEKAQILNKNNEMKSP